MTRVNTKSPRRKSRRKMTVKEHRAKCRKLGKVYDVSTKLCRASRRKSPRRKSPRRKSKSRRKSPRRKSKTKSKRKPKSKQKPKYSVPRHECNSKQIEIRDGEFIYAKICQPSEKGKFNSLQHCLNSGCEKSSTGWMGSNTGGFDNNINSCFDKYCKNYGTYPRNPKGWKKCFRKGALRWHPDKKGGDKKMFQALSECNEKLQGEWPKSL